MDKEFEEFMKKNQKANKEIEDELKKMMDGDIEFKNMKKKKNPDDIDSDDLKELESDNDDLHVDDMDKDLLDLEREGLDDISHEEISGMDIKMDSKKDQNKKPQTEKQNDNNPSKNKKEEAPSKTNNPNVNKKIEEPIKTTNNNKNNQQQSLKQEASLEADSDHEDEKAKNDLYKERTEKLYHAREKMYCAGVLEDEKNVIDEIIKYKKKQELEYDFFTIKKDLLDGEIQKIQNLIIDGALTLEAYKAKIGTQLSIEKKLLENMMNDSNLSAQEKKIIEQRISKRIEIINLELQQEVPEGEGDEEEANNNAANRENEDKINEVKENVIKKINEEEIKPLEPSQKDKIEEEKNKEKKELEKNASVKLAEDPLLNRIKELENEYKSALEYFKKNELPEQEADAMQKYQHILKAKKSVESGKKVNEDDLPKSVDCEYICGMTKKERFESFTNIIKEYNQVKKNFINERNKMAERFSQLPKNELKKIKGHIEAALKEKDSKIDKYDKLVKKLMESLKNPWIPCPKTTIAEEEERHEKVIENIPANTVEINFESTNFRDQTAYLLVSLQLNEKRNFQDFVYLKDFPHKLTWRLEKLEFNGLHRKNLDISIYVKGGCFACFKPAVKGSFKVKMDEFKTKCEIKSGYDIPIPGESVTPKFNLSLGIRSPCVQKEFVVTKKEVMQISKAYPEFQLGNLTGEIIKNEIERRSTIQNKTSKRLENNQSIKAPEQALKKSSFNNEQVNNANINEEKIDAAEFTKDELEDPDYIENMNSLLVMDKKIKQLDEQIKKIEGRPPQKLRQKFLQTKCRYNTLKEQISENSLTVDNYIILLKKQIEKDKRLSLYFKQNDQKDKMALVVDRMNVMIGELDDLIKQMKRAIS